MNSMRSVINSQILKEPELDLAILVLFCLKVVVKRVKRKLKKHF